jgi:hypothetical protein
LKEEEKYDWELSRNFRYWSTQKEVRHRALKINHSWKSMLAEKYNISPKTGAKAFGFIRQYDSLR